jgi:hypothetical protein
VSNDVKPIPVHIVVFEIPSQFILSPESGLHTTYLHPQANANGCTEHKQARNFS